MKVAQVEPTGKGDFTFSGVSDKVSNGRDIFQGSYFTDFPNEIMNSLRGGNFQHMRDMRRRTGRAPEIRNGFV